MEEFKNLKEIMELCQAEIYTGDRNIHATLDFEDLKELQKLINKYKELQVEVKEAYNKGYADRDKQAQEICAECNYIKKYKEQEKVIELMAKDIAEHKIDEDICRQVKDPNNEDCYTTLYYDDSCSDCVIEYYQKQAKGE